jgi:hypothetical protein
MQNTALMEEYSCGGVWAHESAVPEVGGLVCRMPLKAEIYCRRSAARSMLHGRSRLFLQSEECGGADDQTRLLLTGPRSLAFTGEAAPALTAMLTSVGIRSAEVPSDNDDTNLPSFSALADRMVFWYRGNKRLLRQELAAIMSKASPDSRIYPNSLGLESLELLRLCMDHQNVWQEVFVVIKRDKRTGRSVMVTINRPMVFKLSSWDGWFYWGLEREVPA